MERRRGPKEGPLLGAEAELEGSDSHDPRMGFPGAISVREWRSRPLEGDEADEEVARAE